MNEFIERIAKLESDKAVLLAALKALVNRAKSLVLTDEHRAAVVAIAKAEGRTP